jgi:hypothetical protein
MKCIDIDKEFMKGYYRAALALSEMDNYTEALDLLSQYKNDEEVKSLIEDIQLKQNKQNELKYSILIYKQDRI